MMKRTMRLAMAAMAMAAGVPACGVKHLTTIPVDGIAYRPDGSLVLFNQNGIYVYADGALVTEVRHIRLDALQIPPSTAEVPHSGILKFSLSADGNTAAVAYSSFGGTDTRVAVYAIPDGRLRTMFPIAGVGGDPELSALALSPDGSRIFASGENVGTSTVIWISTVVDVDTGVPLWTTNDARQSPLWSPDGATVYGVRWNRNSSQGPRLDALDAGSGVVKWTTDLNGSWARALALVGNGALLATALDPPNTTPCSMAGGCPPTYPFWSTVDGTPAMEFPGVLHTWAYAASSFGINFACNATDTCAVGLNYWDEPAQWNFIQVYKTDGTAPLTLRTPTGKAIDTMAISPDGVFVTIANPFDLGGGATVYRIEDGASVGSRLFAPEAD